MLCETDVVFARDVRQRLDAGNLVGEIGTMIDTTSLVNNTKDTSFINPHHDCDNWYDHYDAGENMDEIMKPIMATLVQDVDKLRAFICTFVEEMGGDYVAVLSGCDESGLLKMFAAEWCEWMYGSTDAVSIFLERVYDVVVRTEDFSDVCGCLRADEAAALCRFFESRINHTDETSVATY